MQAARAGIDVTQTGEVQIAQFNGKQMVRIDDPAGRNPFTNFAVVDGARAMQQPVEQHMAQLQQLQQDQAQQQQVQNPQAAMVFH